MLASVRTVCAAGGDEAVAYHIFVVSMVVNAGPEGAAYLKQQTA
jgi:hypothetical protein